MERRAAITGTGSVSAVGLGDEALWDALVDGRSGFEALLQEGRKCGVAARVPLERGDMPRATQLALAAAGLAWESSGLPGATTARDSIGVVVGTGAGNLDVMEDAYTKRKAGRPLSPVTAFRSFAHATACEVAKALDLQGPVLTVSSGCNSGADALGTALDWLRLEKVDAVLVGGTEAELTDGFLSAMEAAKALATRWNDWPAKASRPFDARRDGNVPGEGAAFLVLERPACAARRGAPARAYLEGFANRAAGSRPSYDPFKPVFDTAPMLRTLRAAQRDAGISADELSTVSANGSSSVFYDPLEAMALAELLGARAAEVPVTSIKSVLGQTGAVTPCLQAIALVISIEKGLVPPTHNVDELDPRCRIDLVRGAPRKLAVRHALANAIGFGGFYYSAMILGAP
jgi:3-oxoacyl-[acyl-carrier-protein] synthase II